MILTDIVTDCLGAYGARYQCSLAKILQFINTIQQVAFNRDLLAFMWWEDYLTVYQDVVLSSIGYVNCAAADVGKPVTDGVVTGTLRSYNNTTRIWQVEASGTFSGAITITGGTGAGTFSSQVVSKGPYSWASLAPALGSLTAYTTSPAVRRMLGVTKVTDNQLFNPTTPQALTDYGFSPSVLNDRLLLENVRKYDMQQALKFISTPDTTAKAYRWVYFFRPPTIAARTDDANLLIPAEFHETVVKEGVGMLADRSTYGDKSPEIVLEPILRPFWNSMQQAYTPMGDNANMTSEGTL